MKGKVDQDQDKVKFNEVYINNLVASYVVTSDIDVHDFMLNRQKKMKGEVVQSKEHHFLAIDQRLAGWWVGRTLLGCLERGHG